MPQSQGHGNGSGTSSQAEQKFSQPRRHSCREAKGAQPRAGGVPWAAAAPGSANVTCLWAGWQILKGVELKKKTHQKPNRKSTSFGLKDPTNSA